MAFPVVTGSNSGAQQNLQSAQPVNLPAGIIAGELLLVFLVTSGGSSTSYTTTWPAGWTTFVFKDVPAARSTKATVAYRIADGTETSPIAVTTGSGKLSSHISFRISGYQGTPEGTPVAAVGASADPPNLAPSWGSAQNLWLAALMHNDNQPTTTWPTNYDTQFERIGLTNGVVAIGMRTLQAASQDPSAFAWVGSQQYTVGTIAVQGTPSVLTPSVSTDPATSIGRNDAVLNGTLDDDGDEACDCSFEWGLTDAYGQETATQSKETGETFGATISGLIPDTTYHFRAKAVNSAGTDYGDDATFTTLPHPARIPLGFIRSPLPAPHFPPVIMGFTSSIQQNLQANQLVALPAGIQAGELLLVFFVAGGGSSTTFSTTWPAGWTNFVFKDQPAGRVTKATVAFRIADGTETSPITVVASSKLSVHVSLRISGYTGTPEGTPLAATGLSGDPPNLAPSWGLAQNLWLATAMRAGTEAVTTWPTGYNSQIERLGTSNGGVSVAYRNLEAASDDPSALVWGTNRQYTVGTVAVRGT